MECISAGMEDLGTAVRDASIWNTAAVELEWVVDDEVSAELKKVNVEETEGVEVEYTLLVGGGNCV